MKTHFIFVSGSSRPSIFSEIALPGMAFSKRGEEKPAKGKGAGSKGQKKETKGEGSKGVGPTDVFCFPIGSMGLVYWPTFTIDFSQM